jgi:hypothetical protein
LCWAFPAFGQCVPVPPSFPLTATAVSTNFAKLYGCINNGAAVPPAVISVATTFTRAVTFLGTLFFPDGVFIEVRHGTLWIHTTGADAPSFNETNLGVTVLTKKGLVQQRVLVGPENSGGIGYRMLRIPNLPTLQ